MSEGWYRDAIIYELHVRAFHDSVGDGVGDLRGLTQKLDYLSDLGITAIWVLPFYPSPLKDDGYDIADYTNINPSYGSLDSFRELLDAAHARGLRVITELVLNHTSDQHPWFQRARRAPPGSPERDFYVWHDTPTRFPEARIIFQDFEASNWTYDHLAKAYYWHRFYSHQPDLNYDNPAVINAILPLVDFWFSLGVDGMRLDAVPYLYEREGTNCENLPETHAFLKRLRQHVDERYPGRMLLAEANQWPEDAVAYFGEGDECHMAFHFPVMPRLFMAMHMGDRFPIVDIMQQTPPIPAGCQWAMFLRNHDELTLEMVSDEERDYMYRAFAHDRVARVNLGIRRRLAPLLGNNRRRIELMNGLLFSLPGTPVIYYGDEIGMGDNIYLGDRNGVRTPMQWSADRNAGFSRANPQRLFLPVIIDPEYHYESINVEAQQSNPSSLLWWMKRLIALRRQYATFSRGDIQFLDPPNRKILAFTRNFEQQTVLVVANLSRFVQHVDLNLEAYRGAIPVELFGSVPLPPIGEKEYPLTLGPHSFYWLELTRPAAGQRAGQPVPALTSAPVLEARAGWERLLANAGTHAFLAAAQRYLRRTLGQPGYEEPIRNLRIQDVVPLSWQGTQVSLLLLHAEFTDAGPNVLVLPITAVPASEAEAWTPEQQACVIARTEGSDKVVLYDPTQEPWFTRMIADAIRRQARWTSRQGAELAAWTLRDYAPPSDEASITCQVVRIEQYHTSVRYGQHSVMKYLRRTEEGLHPDVDMGRLLTETRPTSAAAPLLAALEYRQHRRDPVLLGVMHQFVAHEGDAWQFVLDHLSNFFERVAAHPDLLSRDKALSLPPSTAIWESGRQPPPLALELVGDLLPMASLLGQRLAELHMTLASPADDPSFRPEPFSQAYQRAVYQSMRSVTLDVFHALELHAAQLPEPIRELAARVATREHDILGGFQQLLARPLTGARIRCHGDCHLGQVLFTGKDFIFIDFEGVPSRSIGERRIKRSALRDVVDMLRSFDDAAHATLHGLASGRGRPIGFIREEDRKVLRPWALAWHSWVGNSFVQAYLATARDARFLPQRDDDVFRLFQAFLIEEVLVHLRERLVRHPQTISHLLEFLDQLPIRHV